MRLMVFELIIDHSNKNNGFPIFAQSFDPSNTGIVNFVTGTFTIPNHNFRNQRRISIYTKIIICWCWMYS